MPTINNLSAINSLTGSDNFPVYDTSNGDARRVSLTTILAFMQANLDFSSQVFRTQYAAPSATAFSIQLNNSAENTHLILTPTEAFTDGEIVLPAVSMAIDKQEILVNCTQDITSFTVNGNGAIAVTGAPATITANNFFRLKYDLVTKTWYRVG